jgi:Ca-activated chloride channel family protein
MRRSLFSALVVALVLSGFVLAQTSFGHIHGVVRDGSGARMAGVEVTISGGVSSRRTTLTGDTGEFWFRDVGPGTYTITTKLDGFLPTRSTAVVAPGFTREVTLAIKMSAGVPKEVVPQAAPTGIEGRIIGGTAGGVVGGVAAGAMASPRAIAPGARFNTEAYDKIDDNQWTEVSRRPLSTFSTDVDTASYANVRRFLNHGQLPPKDAVRIEELINYFSYEYPEPASDKPFTVTTAIGECPWNPQHRLA